MNSGAGEDKRCPEPIRSLIGSLNQVPEVVKIECPLCHKEFPNKGCLAKHIKSPARGYRAAHNLANGLPANTKKGRAHLNPHPRGEDEELEAKGRIGGAPRRMGR